MEQFVSTLVWAAIIQGFLLGLIYFFSKDHSNRANRLLGLFLFALIVEALSIFLEVNSVGGYPLDQYFTFPEVKLFFPTFFLHFVLEKVGRSQKFKVLLRILYSVSFLVFAITLVNVILFLLSGSILSDQFPQTTIEGIFMSQQVLAFLLTIPCILIALFQTRDYQKQLQREQSDMELHKLTWIWQFILCMVPITILWGIEIGRVLMGGQGDSLIVLITWFLLAGFIYFVSYKVFRHQSLFEKTGQAAYADWDEPESSVSPEQLDHEICELLQQKMDSEQYFLQPDLTIYDLAQFLDTPSRTISTCINRKFSLNFSEWVNSFRVEVALNMLQNPEFNHLSIEGIGLNAGFNSRSAMYAAFRKKTGKPPGKFRQSQMS